MSNTFMENRKQYEIQSPLFRKTMSKNKEK